jgi:catechol 2,3-dioxygenase-like lactoylglutathione lyase family enzyme
MQVEFIATVAVISPEPPESRRLYMDGLGLPLEGQGDDGYYSSGRIAGAKHFGVWPLSQAAQACFGTSNWPSKRPVPQASVEFEVESAAAVQAAAEELRAKGFSILHDAREEPWGQTVARLLSPEGLIVGVSFTPALRGLLETAEIDIERRLREAGSEFIESHDRTEAAIRAAAQAGMTEEAIARVSGLSHRTVAAFLHKP